MSSLQDSFPYYAEGTVVVGFGRGGKQLGIPTANYEEDVVRKLPANFECGVYYGWAKISGDGNVYKMVQSVGWNPYYKNTLKTMETHLMHKFEHDFYGSHLKVIVLGYIRPMTDFESLEALISAIQNDIAEANKHLEEPICLKYKIDPFLSAPPAAIPGTTTTPTVHSDKLMHQDHTRNCILPSLYQDSCTVDKFAVICGSEKNQKLCSVNSQISSVISTNDFLCKESEIVENGLSKTEDFM